MNEDEPRSAVAADLIASLAEGGEPVDVGHFTIDPAAALAKLRAHQLGNPGDFSLLLVEAAWVAGHGRPSGGVRIALGAMTSVEFRGLALAPGSLPDLFSAALGHRKGDANDDATTQARVLHLLGLAANAALAFEPRQLRLLASDAQGVAKRIRIEPTGEVSVEAPRDESVPPGTIRFELHGEAGGWQRSEGALARLGDHCRHTSFPVWIDGERVSGGPTFGLDEPATPGARADVLLDGKPIGVAGHTADRSASPRLIIVNRGVAIIEPLDALAGIQAVVEVDLPLDISRKRLVEGPELDAIRLAVTAALAGLAAPLPPVPVPPPEPVHLHPFIGWTLALVIVAGITLFVMSISSRSAGPPRLPSPPANVHTRTSPEHRPVADPYAECLRQPSGTTCVTAANAEPGMDRDVRARLLLRGCTFQHDESACRALVELTRTHGSLELTLGFALAMSCLGVAGPDCVEAAEHLRRGDHPPPDTLARQFLMGDPVPEFDADDLLDRACRANVRDACQNAKLVP